MTHWRQWIPQTLRVLRQEYNLTLKELSERCGLSVSYLSDIESGRTVPTLETLDRIVTSYGLTITLSFFEGDYVPPNFVYVRRETLNELAAIVAEITPLKGNGE